LIIGASYLTAKQNPESKKLSAYECGFEPYEDTRHVFDIRFCVIAILFIIFDIEIMFLIPWCASISKLDLLGFWSMIDFSFELELILLRLVCKSSRLGLIIYFVRRTKKI
jgi:NADH-quinone oxidoreductase subunit A